MKQSLFAIATIACLSFAPALMAQEKKEETATKKKHRTVISMGKDGVRVKATDSAGKTTDEGKADEDTDDRSRFLSHVFMMDLGFNMIQDNTDYTNPAVANYLKVPAANLNKNLFNLNNAKSVNVNIYPWMARFSALRTKNQRIYISSGVGFQIYNFRYESPLTYTRNPAGVILDTISFKKDKLSMNYISIPLMLTFKTRLYKTHWLAYGVGITGGYRISSWTKQVSGQRGKVKQHDAFGLADFNTCLSAEIGLDGAIRLYATYQLTSMYDNALGQHPISFGIRLSGI
jgi:hypothetical protein